MNDSSHFLSLDSDAITVKKIFLTKKKTEMNKAYDSQEADHLVWNINRSIH